MKQETSIIVHRKSSCKYLLRAFSILLNKQIVGKIKANQKQQIKIPPGEHQIHVSVDQYHSNTVTLDLEFGQTAHLHCGSSEQLNDDLRPSAALYLKTI